MECASCLGMWIAFCKKASDIRETGKQIEAAIGEGTAIENKRAQLPLHRDKIVAEPKCKY